MESRPIYLFLAIIFIMESEIGSASTEPTTLPSGSDDDGNGQGNTTDGDWSGAGNTAWQSSSNDSDVMWGNSTATPQPPGGIGENSTALPGEGNVTTDGLGGRSGTTIGPVDIPEGTTDGVAGGLGTTDRTEGGNTTDVEGTTNDGRGGNITDGDRVKSTTEGTWRDNMTGGAGGENMTDGAGGAYTTDGREGGDYTTGGETTTYEEGMESTTKVATTIETTTYGATTIEEGIKCFRCAVGLNKLDTEDAYCRYEQVIGEHQETTCDVGQQCRVTRYEMERTFLTISRGCTSDCEEDNYNTDVDDVYSCNKPYNASEVTTKCSFCCDTDYCNYKNSSSGLFQQRALFYFFLAALLLQIFLRDYVSLTVN